MEGPKAPGRVMGNLDGIFPNVVRAAYLTCHVRRRWGRVMPKVERNSAVDTGNANPDPGVITERTTQPR